MKAVPSINFTASAVAAALRTVSERVRVGHPDEFTEQSVLDMVRARVLPPPDCIQVGGPRWSLGQLRDILCSVLPVAPGDVSAGLSRATHVTAGINNAAIHDERQRLGGAAQ